jgi:hypothetical protein
MEINASTKTNSPQLDAAIKRQAQEMGIGPLPLEPELLLKRITDGGFSGAFLAEAFLSAYRMDRPFHHSLGELVKLDAEGFRLFHQILHIRHTKGWSEAALDDLERKVGLAISAPGYQ